MSSTTGSTPRPGKPVRCAAVLTHGRVQAIGPALERVTAVAEAAGVELVFPQDEVSKHDMDEAAHDLADAEHRRRPRRRRHDAAGAATAARHRHPGDRRQLRARRLPDRDRRGRARRAASPRLRRRPRRHRAADARASSWTASAEWPSTTSSRRARPSAGWSSSSWSVGGEPLGRQACDGIICATPPGSTAYNLSNGGPVLVWGLDAIAVTFIAPHSLHARSMVVPRGLDVEVEERDAGRRRDGAGRRPATSARSRPTDACSCASASSARCWPRCRRSRSSAATANTFTT